MPNGNEYEENGETIAVSEDAPEGNLEEEDEKDQRERLRDSRQRDKTPQEEEPHYLRQRVQKEAGQTIGKTPRTIARTGVRAGRTAGRVTTQAGKAAARITAQIGRQVAMALARALVQVLIYAFTILCCTPVGWIIMLIGVAIFAAVMVAIFIGDVANTPERILHRITPFY